MNPNPGPEALRAELARLHAAGERLAARPFAETLDALAGVLDAWRDPRSEWRRALEAELPAAAGFSPETVREGLTRALEGWTGDALRDLAARELSPPGGAPAGSSTRSASAATSRSADRASDRPSSRSASRASDRTPSPSRPAAPGAPLVSGFPTTAVLLAGALPTPTLLSVIAPLVLRSPVLAKTSAQDPVTARIVARSLAAADSALGECIRVTSFPGSDAERTAALLEADCIVATGSDETISTVAARVRGPRRLVGYGHRLSVAALGPEAARGPALEDAAGRLAIDVALWDQLGCLSPVALYVAAGDRQAPARAAEALAAALESAASRWPPGRIPDRAAEAVSRERAEAEMRGAAGRAVRIHAGPRLAFTVVCEPDARPRPAPLHRFVRVHPVPDAAALPEALRPLAPHLSAVGIEGFGAGAGPLARALARLGASRVCPLGTMQAPPLGWHHDGRPVLVPLARFGDLELPGGAGAAR